MNEDQPLFYRAFDQASSNIDLALITDTCPTEYNWSILDDLHGIDHYPILISATWPSPTEYSERWKFEKADWKTYQDLAVTSKKVADQPDIDQAYKHLRGTILDASCRTIPRIKFSKSKCPCLLWLTQECKSERLRVRSTFNTINTFRFLKRTMKIVLTH